MLTHFTLMYRLTRSHRQTHCISQEKQGYGSVTNNSNVSAAQNLKGFTLAYTACPSQLLLILVAPGPLLVEKPSAQTLLVTV